MRLERNMVSKRMGAKIQHTHIEIKGTKVPIKIYRERRRGVRASIGKKEAILRLPKLLPPKEEEKSLKWFDNWLKNQFEKHEDLIEKFRPKAYRSGDILSVGERTYELEIEFQDRKTHYAKLDDGKITLKLSKSDTPIHLNKSIQHLLSRIVANDFLPDISHRVAEINATHFRQKIKGVKLKYNHSSWGSCSTNGYINLSTRLLFAPDAVIDYVIIHELAHLIEFNHSPRFWKIVSKVMPDFKKKEKWLKDHGGKCRF